MKKADTNIMHAKDGFVPIRLAIEKRYIEGVKFLLSIPCVDPTIKDFRGISPLNAAMQKENEIDLINIVQDYMVRYSYKNTFINTLLKHIFRRNIIYQ